MIKNKLLYVIDSNIFTKVLRRLNDDKNTNIFAIPDDRIYKMSRERLKMGALVDDLEGKKLIKYRHSKHILVYHHPYYLIIPIFEYFVFKNGKVNQYLNSLEVKLDKTKKNLSHFLFILNFSELQL